MKKMIGAWMVLAAMCACSNDNEEVRIDTSAIREAASFIDTRDNHEYPCVQVGNQIWMTENLCYLLPLGPLAGCYTWQEETVKASELSLFDEDYVEAVTAMINSTEYDWNTIYPSTSFLKTKDYMSMMLAYIEYGLTQAEINSMFKDAYPEFFAKLEPTFAQYKGAPAREHLAKQEALNGNYSKEYGYLYTYLGALEAVPKEGGWRLPSDEDWTKLETALGMSREEANSLEAWRGAGIGAFLKEEGKNNLNFLLGGGNLYTPNNEEFYIHKDEGGYYWSSTVYYQGELSPEDEMNDDMTEDEKKAALKTTVLARSLAVYSDKVWRGTLRVNAGYRPVTCSVRLVRDAN